MGYEVDPNEIQLDHPFPKAYEVKPEEIQLDEVPNQQAQNDLRLFLESQLRPVKNVTLPGERMTEPVDYRFTPGTTVSAPPEEGFIGKITKPVREMGEALLSPWGKAGEEVRGGLKKSLATGLLPFAGVVNLVTEGLSKGGAKLGVPKGVTEAINSFGDISTDYWIKMEQDADRKVAEAQETGFRPKSLGGVTDFTAEAVAQTVAMSPEIAKAALLGAELPAQLVAKFGGDKLMAGMVANAIAKNIRKDTDPQTAAKKIIAEIAPLVAMGRTERLFSQMGRVGRATGSLAGFEAGSLTGGALTGHQQTKEELLATLAAAAPFAGRQLLTKDRAYQKQKTTSEPQLKKEQTDNLSPKEAQRRADEREWREYKAAEEKAANEKQAEERGLTPEQNMFLNILLRDTPLKKRQIGQIEGEGRGTPESKTAASSSGMGEQEARTAESMNFLRQPDESVTQVSPSSSKTGVPEGSLTSEKSDILNPPSPETIIPEKENVKPLVQAEAEAIVKEAPAPKAEALPQGAGAANVGQFTPKEYTIKNTQAEVQAERARRGDIPIEKGSPITDPVILEQGREMYGGVQTKAEGLVKQQNDKPRVLSAPENSMLLHYRADLVNERNKAQVELEWAQKTGDAAQGEKALQTALDVEQKIADLHNALMKGNSEWGRAGHWLQQVMKQDFSLAALERRATMAKGGEPLTLEERKKLEKQAANIEALEARVKEYEAKEEAVAGNAKAEAQAELENIQKELDLAKSNIAANEKVIATAKQITQMWGSKNKVITQDIYDAASAKVADFFATHRMTGPVPTEIMPDLLKMAAYHIEAGARTIESFTFAMTSRLGDGVKPYLPDLFNKTIKSFPDKKPTANPKDKFQVEKGIKASKKTEFEKAVDREQKKLDNINKELADVEKGIMQKQGKDRKPDYLDKNGKVLDLRKQQAEAKQKIANLKKEYQEGLEKFTGITKADKFKIKQLEKRAKELRRRIAENDFAPKPKTFADKRESVAVKMARTELERAKREFNDAEAKWKWDNQSRGKKAMHYVLETLGLPRAIMATMDLSAPGRQGIIHVATPYFWKTAKEMFSWAKSEESAQWADAELATHADYDIAKNAGLEFYDISKQGGAVPEVRVSALPEKFLPGARASNRSYAVFLNTLRMRAFEHFYELTGRDSTKAKAIADFVNKTTGAGNLSGILSAGGQRVVNVGFFAPKLAISRFQSLDPRIYTRMGKEARNEAVRLIAKDVILGVSVLSSIAMGAKMAGRDDVTVGIDPRNADFGKLKVGNTRYDIFGGYSQIAVLMARIALNMTNSLGITDTPEMISSVSGKQMMLGGKYGDPTALQIIGRFVENKQSPFMQWVMMASRKGKTATGEKVNVPGAVIDNFIPMFANDLRDLTMDRNFWQALPMYAPGFFGVGVQTYGEQVPYREGEKIRWKSNPSVGDWVANKATQNPVSNIPETSWGAHQKRRRAEWKRDIEKEKAKTLRDKLREKQRKE